MDIQALIFHPARPFKGFKGRRRSGGRRRPLKPLEEHVGTLQKAEDMLLRILSVILIFNVLP
jgi:hypothetical protein